MNITRGSCIGPKTKCWLRCSSTLLAKCWRCTAKVKRHFAFVLLSAGYSKSSIPDFWNKHIGVIQKMQPLWHILSSPRCIANWPLTKCVNFTLIHSIVIIYLIYYSEAVMSTGQMLTFHCHFAFVLYTGFIQKICQQIWWRHSKNSPGLKLVVKKWLKRTIIKMAFFGTRGGGTGGGGMGTCVTSPPPPLTPWRPARETLEMTPIQCWFGQFDKGEMIKKVLTVTQYLILMIMILLLESFTK